MELNTFYKNFLKQVGLEPIKSDQCTFKKRKSNLILAIYVDNAITHW